MRLGFNLLLWTTSVTDEHLPLCEELRDAGYDGVEVPLAPDDAAMKKLGAQLGDLGLARTAVTSVDESTDPISADPAVRSAATAHLRAAVQRAAALGASVLCGPFHSAYKVFRGRGPSDDERAWCAEALRPVAEEAELCGVTLALEPLNRFECYLINTAEDAADLARRVDHPAFGLLYDTHHMHIEAKDVGQAVAAMGPHLAHVHASENDRGTPGSGQVRWAETFRALHAQGYDGWLTVEAFSRLDPDFAGAIHIWRDFDPLEEVWRDGATFLREAWSASGRSQ